jgi:hypothetical protein
MNVDMNGAHSRMIAWVWALTLALSTLSVNAQNKKPNFVMIITDDVGWGDLGSYDGGIMRAAPNLDRMAAESMRFLNYYRQASCTAGGSSFITGRVPIGRARLRKFGSKRSRKIIQIKGIPWGRLSANPAV